ncbi:MAG: DNA cytosine methyltransferase [Fuerstiella sp.]|nr:DNA cytosine methyltransferase [Fuerstiella sp.]
MNELALFAGAGGGILGGHLLGWRTICAVEQNHFAAAVLAMRQNDGILSPFPIWDDVRTFDGKPWRGIADVVSGGFPCQDISVNGSGEGITGERSGLWCEMSRIIREVQPRFVFVENSPALTVRGLGSVLGDLAEMGFDAEWGCVSAAECGAPHKRDRIWIVGYPNSVGLEGEQQRLQVRAAGSAVSKTDRREVRGWIDIPKPYGIRSTHGVAHYVDRIKAIGNGQVPVCAATAFQLLSERIGQ